MSDQVQSQWRRLTLWLHRAKDRTFIASTASLIFLAISVISAFFETPSPRELLFEAGAVIVIFIAGRQPVQGASGVIVGTMLGITTAYRDMPEVWVLASFTSVGILGSYSWSRQKRISCTILFGGFAAGFATDWIVSGNVAVIPVLLLTAIWLLSHLVRMSIDRRLEHLQHQAAVERSTLRTTIARDVHDIASHTMMAVIVQLRVAQKSQLENKYDIATARVTAALDAASAALRSLRGLSHVVHSSDSTGNAITLAEFCKQIENQAAYYDDVSVSHQGDGNVPESTCLAILRIAQQCLDKLRCRDRVQLVILAYERGLVRPGRLPKH